MNKIPNNFPKVINGYRFQRLYRKKIHTRTSRFAVYVNDKKEVALGKMSIISDKIWEKYWLNNEHYIYQTLNTYTPKKNNVATPKLLGTYEGKGYSVLLLTFINGKTIEGLPAVDKLKAIDLVLTFFAQINQNSIFSNNYSKILSRKGEYFVSLFPFFVIVAIIKHSEIGKYIPNIISIYISSILRVIANSKVLFIHRDLNEANIIASGKKFWVVDFQSSLFADYRFELANIAINFWHDSQMRKNFYSINNISKIIKNANDLKIYQFYSLYGALSEISRKNHKIEDWLINYLNHILSLHFDSSRKISYD